MPQTEWSIFQMRGTDARFISCGMGKVLQTWLVKQVNKTKQEKREIQALIRLLHAQYIHDKYHAILYISTLRILEIVSA